ncbi:kunitz-type serine protease inhibitor conotoxin Cal9.1c-like [Ornithodoros turicata]|uniref:kunitz-type serine protease inhibitor conotoxin Cal9.1c-like n=1 Tax=Ornithodoros turicata TaxID=34597 RepID=UPI00313897DC
MKPVALALFLLVASCASAVRDDICFLPHTRGPIQCLAYIPMYTFNSGTGRCESFVYGGCRGTANRFPTLGDCEERCGGPNDLRRT